VITRAGEINESPFETVPVDLPDLEWLDKDVDSLSRLACHFFGIRTEFRTPVVGPFGALVMTRPTNEERRHALSHHTAVGWAKVQPMEGCQRCFPQSPSSTSTSDGSPGSTESAAGSER
jgi:hypothetical protein